MARLSMEEIKANPGDLGCVGKTFGVLLAIDAAGKRINVVFKFKLKGHKAVNE